MNSPACGNLFLLLNMNVMRYINFSDVTSVYGDADDDEGDDENADPPQADDAFVTAQVQRMVNVVDDPAAETPHQQGGGGDGAEDDASGVAFPDNCVCAQNCFFYFCNQEVIEHRWNCVEMSRTEKNMYLKY